MVTVTHPGEHAGETADAAVTAHPGCVLAVRSADCAPVILLGTGAVGIVHAGWRGVLDGVLERAVRALRTLDEGPVAAELGPCIRAGCYEFDGSERDRFAARFGDPVLATTTWGAPALDLPAAVRAALAEGGVTEVRDRAACTACDPRWFSFRARGEAERFATTVWIDDSTPGTAR